MRQAGMEKMGFYPLPPQTQRLMLNYLRVPAGQKVAVRLLDPCAGEGVALAAIRDHLQNQGATVFPHAVEISEYRARKAARLLGEQFVLHAPWEQTKSSLKAISCLYLNPPYDFEALPDAETGKHKRQEYTFLERSEGKLQDGGLLVFVIPQVILGIKAIARHLSARYERIVVRALPDDEFANYRQVVLFGVKRPMMVSDPDMMEQLLMMAIARPPALDVADVVEYGMPPALPGQKYIFQRINMSDAEIAQMLVTHGAMHAPDWRDFANPQTDITFRPVIPLKAGHIGSLIASGMIGVINLGQFLLRGRSIKTRVAKDKDGNTVPLGHKSAVKEIEQFSTEIYQIFQDGAYKLIKDATALQALLDAYAVDIANIVAQKYVPLYTQPTPKEWAKASTYMPKKKLPGRKVAGLLPTQKHAVIALARTARRYGGCDNIAEQGSGKGPMGVAIADMLNAWPLIVLGPGHMVKKWQKEIADTVPGATAVVVRSVAQVNAFVRDYRPGQKKAIIISEQAAKLGPGWVPNAMRRTFALTDFDPETKQPIGKRYEVLPCCPACGAPAPTGWDRKAAHCKAKRVRRKWNPETEAWDEQEYICHEPLFHYGRNAISAEARRWTLATPATRRQMEEEAATKGRVLDKGFTAYSRHKWAVARFIHNQLPHFFKALIADEVHEYKGKGSDRAYAYYELLTAVRYGINLTGTYFGGKSSDMFYLRFRVDPEVRKEFKWGDEERWAGRYGRLEYKFNSEEEGSTGVYSGKRRTTVTVTEKAGISPGVYQHLLKTALFLRIADLGYQLPDYIENIVRLRMTAPMAMQYNWLDATLFGHIKACLGSYDAALMAEGRSLLAVWLNQTLFRPNSAYRTEAVWWHPPYLPKHTHRPYRVAKDSSAELGFQAADDQAARERNIVDHFDSGDPLDHRGEYPFNLSPEQWKQYIGDDKEPMVLYPVNTYGDLLPKERWIVDEIQEQRIRRRRVLLYVSQTGTRDIRQRLATVLKANGIKAQIMPDMDPSRREEWINAHADEMDVLITNPNLVKTGLDLVRFASCMFFEVQTSLFTMAQAMRRVWRLGQINDVEVFFPIYDDTAENGITVCVMEGRMLTLIASKMAAMLLLYGDSAATALTEESDMDDLTQELAKAILEDRRNELTSAGLESIMAGFIAPPTDLPWEEVQELIDMAELGAALNAEETAEAAAAAFEDAAEEQVPLLDALPPAVGVAGEETPEAITVPWWEAMAQETARRKAARAAKKGQPAPAGQMDIFGAVLAQSAAPTSPQAARF